MRKNEKVENNKLETSKLIILISYVIGIILIGLVIAGTFMQIDVTNLTTITVVSLGEISASNIWYFKKASKENVPKIIKTFPKAIREQVDVNQLLNN